MDDVQRLIEELRFGAENGADAELLECAADKIQELVADLGDADAMTEYWMKKNKWVRCKERMPEEGARCLVVRFDDVTNTPFLDILWFDGIWWNRMYKDCGDFNVTHWMPLPDAPEVEG